MLNAIATTDWHIDSFARFFVTPEAALDAQFVEIEKPFQYAVENDVPHVLMLGDVGEHATLSEGGKLRLLSLLLKYDGLVNIWFILGNHDYAHEGEHNMQLFDMLTKNNRFKTVRLFVQPEQKKIDGITVNFLPYPAVEALSSSGPCLNLAHLEVNNALRDSGMRATGGIDIPDDGDYWLIGHFHTYQEGPNHLYVGTGWQKNFGEQGRKGFCHIQARMVKGKLKVSHTHIEGKPKLKLYNWKDATSEQLASVSRDPCKLYRIEVADGVEIPSDLKMYPNVLSLTGRTRTAVSERIGVENSIDITHGLDKAIAHMSPKEQRRAHYWVSRGKAACQISS